jgi:hypothetical protein
MSPAWTVYSRVQPARAVEGWRAGWGWVSARAGEHSLEKDAGRTGRGEGEGEEGAEGEHAC